MAVCSGRNQKRTPHEMLASDFYVCMPLAIGGASRDRTDDPLLAKQVLSQLSYGPW